VPQKRKNPTARRSAPWGKSILLFNSITHGLPQSEKIMLQVLEAFQAAKRNPVGAIDKSYHHFRLKI
jgi:hypothetical protein